MDRDPQHDNMNKKTFITDFGRFAPSEPRSLEASAVVAACDAALPQVAVQSRMPLWYRAFERAVAAIALIVFLPAMLAIGLVVRLGTPGPALFLQRRLGAGAKTFTFPKFRTMYLDARARFPEQYRYRYNREELEQLYFKREDDPRLTPQGRWLRRTTLDELPNFYAVLTGKMALVGPRPEIPEMLPYYQGTMLKKFSVPPGITGLAQTCGRGHLTFFDTVKYDVEYVEQQSVLLNLKILLRTLKVVLRAHGAF
jgi:lipopolysaccharide/colanic/teichoic acid biosynthesis glycosyltransferase